MKPNAICLSLLSIVFVIQSCADQDTKENESNARTEAEKTISLKEDSAYFFGRWYYIEKLCRL